MITKKRSEAKKEIREEILRRLKAELKGGGRLTGLKGVYDGERIRLAPEFPCIFLIREDELVSQQRIHQTFEYELSLLAIAVDDEPDVGLDKAEHWAAEASFIATQAPRDLGLAFVNDAKLMRSIPVSGPHTEGRRVGSVDVIMVTYTIVQE
ncbi:hypothetical protein LCGC14_2293880 [marine sediment metagenome]|uniref:Uncharacterized protein n=1 Tax=marine sediment metagenome TaxID=412755 RepID=A0A0F9F2X2_9ZZZZ